jgi:hypothetical protein
MISNLTIPPIVNKSRLQVGEKEDGDGDDGEAMKSMAAATELRCRLDLAMMIECAFLCVYLSNVLGSFTFYTGFDKTKPPTHGTVSLTGRYDLNSAC